MTDPQENPNETNQEDVGKPWRRPMTPRDSDEVHRQSTFLELFVDLCFVVAIAQVAAQLHHALIEHHFVTGILTCLTVSFAIGWAWVNFTWFASASDNDDVPYRLGSLAQIVGALILAAGVPEAFAAQDFDCDLPRVCGYALWLCG